jgi:hypothetical protein
MRFTRSLYQYMMRTKFAILFLLITVTTSAQISIMPRTPTAAPFQRYDQINHSGNRGTNIPTNQYQYNLESSDMNRQLMQETDAYTQEQEEQKRIVHEAIEELTPKIRNYKLTSRNLKGKSHYQKAFNELNNMLDDGNIDLKRAVFLVEHAYDTTLNYGRFKIQINKLVEIIGLKMKQDKISPNDNIGKIMTLFNPSSFGETNNNVPKNV